MYKKMQDLTSNWGEANKSNISVKKSDKKLDNEVRQQQLLLAGSPTLDSNLALLHKAEDAVLQQSHTSRNPMSTATHAPGAGHREVCWNTAGSAQNWK